MKSWILVLLALLIPATGDRAPVRPSIDQHRVAALVEYIHTHYQTPEDYIISKFKDHDIVFLGEWHRIKHDPELVQRLIPRLYRAGIYCLGTEFARRVDQPLIDKLLDAPEYDEQLARLITFKQFVVWGYQEYVDVFKAAWQLNHTLPAGSRRFRILGLENSYDFSYVKTPEDSQSHEVMAKVLHGQTEADWARVLLDEVVSRGEKALVYCGTHHSFTRYRQPMVVNGKLLRLVDTRVGNVVFRRIGKRAFTIWLHAPWDSAAGYDKPCVLAADGYIDAMLTALDHKYQYVGFDLAGTPFGTLPGETSIYKLGHQGFTLAQLCDGYVCQGPLSAYEGVTPIKNFVNAGNLEEARAQVPNPRMRNSTAEEFNQAIAADADIPKRFLIVQ